MIVPGPFDRDEAGHEPTHDGACLVWAVIACGFIGFCFWALAIGVFG